MTFPTPLHTLSRKLESHGALDEDDRRAILNLPQTLRSFDPGGYVGREGDVPVRVAVLISGFVVAHKITGPGARQIVALYLPGEPLDLQHLYLECADQNLQAITRAVVAFTPRAAMHDLVAARTAVARAVWLHNLIEASIFRDWITNIGRRTALPRLAHWLCEMGMRFELQGIGTRTCFDLPMTQEQIADTVGLTPVHVNRTLKALATQGLVRRRHRRIELPDWNAISEFADFNPRYLHIPRKPGSPPGSALRQLKRG
jgi:CRP-like cAMP-binding protein